MSVYYASKAYVLSFSEGLREELQGQGIHVCCLAPGATATEFGADSGMNELSLFSNNLMSAAKVARLGHCGYRRNQAVIIPGVANRILVSCVKFLPRSLTRKTVCWMQRPANEPVATR